MIKVFDAFAGIGGFRSAFERVGGFKIVAWCEIDHFAQKSYRALYDTGGEDFYKDIKALMADLKKVYTAVDEEAALDALDSFAAAWDSKYPKISKSWYENWPNLSTYFKFPQELRKLIYTTNTIEGFNRQLKKVTKAKSVFPTDDSLFKMLYLAMKDITKKWTGRRQDWSQIYAQLVIYYGDRIPE